MCRLAVVVVIAAGCDSVFGLDPTQPLTRDAQQFDAPIDAPFACAPIGSTPQFSTLVHQVFHQDCRDYAFSTSAGFAVASCQDALFATQFASGPIDHPLPLVSISLTPSDAQINRVWLAPAGDELFVLTYSSSLTLYTVLTYTHQPDGSWSRGADFTTAPAYFQLSAPTRGPTPHIVRTFPSDPNLHELAEMSPGSWVEVAVHSLAELGVSYPDNPHLSSDGLRLLMVTALANRLGETVVAYTDRASLGAPFRPAVALTDVPNVPDAFMTEDCSRIYFSGIGSIFYVQQR
jgi:hypothetical protein